MSHSPIPARANGVPAFFLVSCLCLTAYADSLTDIPPCLLKPAELSAVNWNDEKAIEAKMPDWADVHEIDEANSRTMIKKTVSNIEGEKYEGNLWRYDAGYYAITYSLVSAHSTEEERIGLLKYANAQWGIPDKQIDTSYSPDIIPGSKFVNHKAQWYAGSSYVQLIFMGFDPGKDAKSDGAIAVSLMFGGQSSLSKLKDLVRLECSGQRRQVDERARIDSLPQEHPIVTVPPFIITLDYNENLVLRYNNEMYAKISDVTDTDIMALRDDDRTTVRMTFNRVSGAYGINARSKVIPQIGNNDWGSCKMLDDSSIAQKF